MRPTRTSRVLDDVTKRVYADADGWDERPSPRKEGMRDISTTLNHSPARTRGTPTLETP